jgi:hypothetical protein
MLLAQAIETLRAVGLDLPGFLNADDELRDRGSQTSTAQVPASARAALDDLQHEVDDRPGSRS